MESNQKLNNRNRILVIGPSGVGKSTISKKIAEICNYEYIDLDVAAKVHDGSEYPKRGVEIIEAVERRNDGKTYIIDIGAGFQNQEALFEFFEERKSRLLCIYAPPDIAYLRNINRKNSYWENKTIDAYKECEYSEYRERLYSLGEKTINTDAYNTGQKMCAWIESFPLFGTY